MVEIPRHVPLSGLPAGQLERESINYCKVNHDLWVEWLKAKGITHCDPSRQPLSLRLAFRDARVAAQQRPLVSSCFEPRFVHV